MKKPIAFIGREPGMCGTITTISKTPFQPLIDLFNSWMHHYFVRTLDPHCIRYGGYEGTCWDSDTQSLARTIADRINTGVLPTYKEKLFINRIRNVETFFYSKIYYKAPAIYYFNKKDKFGVNPEGSFKLMQKLFNERSMHDALKDAIYTTRISGMLRYIEKNKGRKVFKDKAVRRKYSLDAKERDWGVFGTYGGTV